MGIQTKAFFCLLAMLAFSVLTDLHSSVIFGGIIQNLEINFGVNPTSVELLVPVVCEASWLMQL